MNSRLVVITGGHSGIGAASVDRFRREGDDVVILDVADPAGPVDVTDENTVEAAFDRLPRPPDVVVNAAGIGHGAEFVDLSWATWRRVLAVNLDGTFLCMRAAARRMTTGAGAIVNVSSINDRWPLRTAAAYCASKAAVSMLTQVAALELGSQGIRVNAVAPGLVDTPLVAPVLRHPAVQAAVGERTPLQGRAGTVSEIADVVAFLASDDARWMTGAVVVVDGGLLLNGEPDLARLLGSRPERHDGVSQ